MHNSILSVRELTVPDIDPLIDYWMIKDDAFWLGMGVDTSKLPPPEQWRNMLEEQIYQSYREKQSYCIIWLLHNKPIGHSNINKIIFGQEAYMHLHIWEPQERQRGIGSELVKMTLPYFFKHMQLHVLYCEPYAHNPAPNKTLQRLGFEFVKQHYNTPGWLNFEQQTNVWKMEEAYFKEKYSYNQ